MNREENETSTGPYRFWTERGPLPGPLDALHTLDKRSNGLHTASPSVDEAPETLLTLPTPVYFAKEGTDFPFSVVCEWVEGSFSPSFQTSEFMLRRCFGVSLDDEADFSLSDAIRASVGRQNRAVPTLTLDDIVFHTVGASLRLPNSIEPIQDKLILCTLALKRVLIARKMVAFIRKHGYVKGPQGLKLTIELPKELSVRNEALMHG